MCWGQLWGLPRFSGGFPRKHASIWAVPKCRPLQSSSRLRWPPDIIVYIELLGPGDCFDCLSLGCLAYVPVSFGHADCRRWTPSHDRRDDCERNACFQHSRVPQVMEAVLHLRLTFGGIPRLLKAANRFRGVSIINTSKEPIAGCSVTLLRENVVLRLALPKLSSPVLHHL